MASASAYEKSLPVTPPEGSVVDEVIFSPIETPPSITKIHFLDQIFRNFMFIRFSCNIFLIGAHGSAPLLKILIDESLTPHLKPQTGAIRRHPDDRIESCLVPTIARHRLLL